MEVSSERCFYSGPISDVLVIISVPPHPGLGSDGTALSEDTITVQHLDMRQVLRDELSSLHCSGHVGVEDVSVGQVHVSQSHSGAGGLVSPQLSQVSLTVILTIQIILTMSDQYQVSARLHPPPLIVVVVISHWLSLVPVPVPPWPGPGVGAVIIMSCCLSLETPGHLTLDVLDLLLTPGLLLPAPDQICRVKHKFIQDSGQQRHSSSQRSQTIHQLLH